MVTIGFTVAQELTRAAFKDSYLEQQKQFLIIMNESYGPEEIRWNIRWSDYGADIRFDNASDAGSFIMLHTVTRDVMMRPYVGIRGH